MTTQVSVRLAIAGLNRIQLEGRGDLQHTHTDIAQQSNRPELNYTFIRHLQIPATAVTLKSAFRNNIQTISKLNLAGLIRLNERPEKLSVFLRTPLLTTSTHPLSVATCA